MIGIIGAMEEEIRDLKSVLKDCRVERHASKDYYVGELEGKEVVLVQSGVGKVNAAVAAEVLSGIFKCEYIINTGVAGSLDAAMDIGDIVLSTDSLQHDVDVTGRGFEKGVIPRQDISVFPASDYLRNIAKMACGGLDRDFHVWEGRVVSGDQYISDSKVKAELAAHFNGKCAEMEGAAIAQTAWLNNVPYLIIRAISDKADESAHMDYPTFKQKAIVISVSIIKEMIKLI